MLPMLLLSAAFGQSTDETGQLPFGTRGACAAWVPSRDRIYVVGGESSPGQHSVNVQIIDPNPQVVTVGPSLAVPVPFPNCAVLGEDVLLVGSNGVLVRYSPATAQTSFPGGGPVVGPVAAASDGVRLFVLTTSGLQIWDPVTQTWTSGGANLYQRFEGAALAVSHGWLWVFGGTPNTAVVERAPLADLSTWQPYGALPTAVGETQVALFGDYAVLHAPDFFQSTSSMLRRFDLVSGAARNLDVYLPRAVGHTAIATARNRAWVIGGVAAGGNISGVVQRILPPTGTPDLDGDLIPDDWDNDEDGDGLDDNADTCERAAGFPDADLDQVCDLADVCPLDPLDDVDQDGVCADLDLCPLSAQDDSDGDGSCDDADLCLGDDRTDDVDLDGVCADLDPCPVDIDDDSDGDGFCDSQDLCLGADLTGDDDGDGLCNDRDFTLLVSPLRRGQTASFAAFQAPPGATVRLWASTRGFGALPCPEPGTCGVLASPVSLGASVADAAGTARWTVQVPTVPVGLNVLFQASWSMSGEADLSGPVHRRVGP